MEQAEQRLQRQRQVFVEGRAMAAALNAEQRPRDLCGWFFTQNLQMVSSPPQEIVALDVGGHIFHTRTCTLGDDNMLSILCPQ